MDVRCLSHFPEKESDWLRIMDVRCLSHFPAARVGLPERYEILTIFAVSFHDTDLTRA
jgi:hypothetical protein